MKALFQGNQNCTVLRKTTKLTFSITFEYFSFDRMALRLLFNRCGYLETEINMTNYYAAKLSAERLRLCYRLSPDRIKQYHEAEIITVLDRLKPDKLVLELGCGYGRVLKRLAEKSSNLFGIDIALGNLTYAHQTYLRGVPHNLFQMNAVQPAFRDAVFDFVICIQNGISAFNEAPEKLIAEAVRITRPGGQVLFSSYSEKIWPDRLKWFRIQSHSGLVGEIDDDLTGDGVIICKDGFRATTFGKSDFMALTEGLNKNVELFEVDDSALFCVIRV